MGKANGKLFTKNYQLVNRYIRVMSSGRDIHNLDKRFEENRKKFIDGLKPHGFNSSYAHQIAAILYNTELLAYRLLREKTIEGIKKAREEKEKNIKESGRRQCDKVDEEPEETKLPKFTNTLDVRERELLFHDPRWIRIAAKKTKYKGTLEYYVGYIQAIDPYTSS